MAGSKLPTRSRSVSSASRKSTSAGESLSPSSTSKLGGGRSPLGKLAGKTSALLPSPVAALRQQRLSSGLQRAGAAAAVRQLRAVSSTCSLPSSSELASPCDAAAATSQSARKSRVRNAGLPIEVTLRAGLTGDLIGHVRLLPLIDKVQYLQDEACKKAGLPVNALQLVFDRRLLDDETLPIEATGLGDGDCVLVMRLRLPRLLTAAADRAFVWNGQACELEQSLSGHTMAVLAASFAPGQQEVVTASADGTARIWDAASGRCLHTLAGHSSSVRDATFSACGSMVLTASNDCTARVWDAATGECRLTLRGHSAALRAAAFGSSSIVVATASDDRTAALWCTCSGQRTAVLGPHGTFVLAVAFAPDDTLVATGGSDRLARIWSAANGQCLQVIRGIHGNIRSLAFSPQSGGRTADGSHAAMDDFLLATACDNGSASLWAVPRESTRLSLEETSISFVRKFLGHSDLVVSVRFSADGSLLLTGSCDRTAKLWHVRRGCCLLALPSHAGLLTAASL
eukprot:TRINITY_DN111092_c0_g1_i1.p1 TRINITY_DN111092_c0_g1~~TRINITY_DN111092_c0_g1_i1.p1  ORF type:complete len:514 (-),score=96.45 TRINITY_DN111092_c0_g1_i1:69-1610(-)